MPATNPLAGKKLARMGVGGIVILGGGARSGIGGDLAAVLRAAPHGVKPFIASDEEGGLVQRLRDVIYPLPSARVQGTWSASKTRAAAEAYGARLRKLHVAVDFAPVADLDIPGKFISSQDRAFSRDPAVVGSHVVAWVKGLRAARVLSTVKHWPGHGWASDTHTGAARVPSLSVLRKADMLPFEDAFAAGVPLRHGRAPALQGTHGRRDAGEPLQERADVPARARRRQDRHHHRLAVHGRDDQGAGHQAARRGRARAQGRRRPGAVRHRRPRARSSTP